MQVSGSKIIQIHLANHSLARGYEVAAVDVVAAAVAASFGEASRPRAWHANVFAPVASGAPAVATSRPPKGSSSEETLPDEAIALITIPTANRVKLVKPSPRNFVTALRA